MFVFFVSRISTILFLVFLSLFAKRKYSIVKTVLIEILAFLLTTVTDFIPGLITGDVTEIVSRSLTVIILLGTMFVICQYKDSRTLFTGVVCLCYTLPGNVFGYIVYLYSRSELGSIAIQLSIHIIFLVYCVIFFRDKLHRALETQERDWFVISLVPALFLVGIILLTRSSTAESISIRFVVGMVLMMLLPPAILGVLANSFKENQQREQLQKNINHLGRVSSIIKNTSELSSGFMKFYRFAMIGILIFMAGNSLLVVYNNVYSTRTMKRVSLEEFSDSDSPLHAELKPKNGKNDTWMKKLNNGQKLCAMTYELTVTNYSEFDISDWEMKIVAPCDMYLNNAWCGTVEVHQFGEGGSVNQEIDLQNLKFDELKLNYVEGEAEPFIVLKTGDYFIYKPDSSVSESPIPGTNVDNRPHSVTIGLILYKESGPYHFAEMELYYQNREPLTRQVSFIVLLCVCGIFVCMGLFGLGNRMQRKSEYEIQQKDRQLIYEIMDAFVGFVDAKDSYTAGHSNRVAEYSRLIAQKLDFSEAEVLQVYYSGLLHDCGKISIPEKILNKPGRLDDSEFEVIKSHTVKGYEILKNLSSIPSAAIAARLHHERYDGKGYPDGRKGEEIPLIARIISIADAFDAMNYSRVYRPHLTRDQIISELKKNSGTQFDAKLVTVLLGLIEEGKIYIYSGE